MSPRLHPRLFLFLSLAPTALWASSCVAPLGPGYTIESQEIHVKFVAGPEPRIVVDSQYRLRNTGNRPLSSLELRLPGRRRFRYTATQVAWDKAQLSEQESPANARDTEFALPERWKTNESRTLKLSVEFLPPAVESAGLSFSSDAFFLPSEGWAPELLPAQGLFGTGGIPPKRWSLTVAVPRGFLVHTSGRIAKISRQGDNEVLVAFQTPDDRYPFVVGGLYKESSPPTSSSQKILLWTRAPAAASNVGESADALARAIEAYNASFGARVPGPRPLWFVECPVVAGCFSESQSAYAAFLSSAPASTSSELASQDTLMVDVTGGPPKLAAVAPALAATWLGYGQNPGFYEQQPPLSALPAFASAVGQEAIEGSASRRETIRRALRLIPANAPASRKPEDASVLRAKSFLFFYGLEDRYGQDAFRRALNHMLSARWQHGFNLDDLIAAFEEESHENVAEFVRLWMKRPGVPQDFRARYENASASIASNSKETMP